MTTKPIVLAGLILLLIAFLLWFQWDHHPKCRDITYPMNSARGSYPDNYTCYLVSVATVNHSSEVTSIEIKVDDRSVDGRKYTLAAVTGVDSVGLYVEGDSTVALSLVRTRGEQIDVRTLKVALEYSDIPQMIDADSLFVGPNEAVIR